MAGRKSDIMRKGGLARRDGLDRDLGPAGCSDLANCRACEILPPTDWVYERYVVGLALGLFRGMQFLVSCWSLGAGEQLWHRPLSKNYSRPSRN